MADKPSQAAMFAVVFESEPDPNRFNAYIDVAKSLRPELEGIDGFVENIRYKSLARPGWLLSLSIWADEKALVRWRTRERHHLAQEKGRDGILLDYHLRVGQIVRERVQGLGTEKFLEDGRRQRFDETHIGEAKMLVLVDGLVDPEADKSQTSLLASELGLVVDSSPQGLVAWDVMDEILDPGSFILLSSWSSEEAAAEFCAKVPTSLRHRNVRVIRDYGKYDRREAPQFYKDATGRETTH